MRPTLRPIVLSGIALLFVAFASSGCEPEFQDDHCEVDDDCFPDEQCIDNRCVFEEGWNECGGNEVLEHSVGDPCGPCDLDEYRCPPGVDDPESLECYPGDTECPDLDVMTNAATDVGDRSATLSGTIQEFPHEAEIVEIGFCWTESSDDPTLDDTCEALDEVPDAIGEFSLEVDGLRPGTEHLARAYSETDVGTEELANVVDFTTGAPAPENVEATSTSDWVAVTWDEIDGATGYEVRIAEDDDQLHAIDDPEETSFHDDTAPAGSLGAPQNPEATTNEATGVQITWQAPEGVEGDDVTYEVRAVYPDAQSDYSDPVDGYRSAPDVAGYDLYVADDDNGQWMPLGNTESYLDTEAPKAPLTPGVISASDGESAEHVSLQFEDDPQVGDAPEQTYRLRTLYGPAEMIGGETGEFTGRRGTTGIVDIQWYRSEGSDASDFEEIDGATDPTYDDDAPAPGEVRYYFAEVDAVESAPEETNTDSGYIAAGGAVTDVDITDITADSAELSAEVVGVGDPAADEHGFCFSTESDVSYDDDDCIELGTPDATEPAMSATLDADDLEPGTTYHAVAFIHSETTGTVYSAEQPFTTAPSAPEGLVANDGVLNWDDVDGADHYEVYRDGVNLDETTDTTFTDDDDLAPLAPTDVTASDDDAAQITVQWEAPDSTDAIEYTVVAVIEPGADGATKTSVQSAPAFDDLPAPDHYEIRYQIDGGGFGDWNETSDTNYVFDDDAAPSIEIGALSASEDNPDGILIDIDVIDDAPIEASAGDAVDFQLRSVSDADLTSGEVDTTGMRDADDLQEQIVAVWEFDDEGQWEILTTIDDIDDPSYLDSEPDHEESRTYRAVAELQNVDGTLTESPTIDGSRGEQEGGGDD